MFLKITISGPALPAGSGPMTRTCRGPSVVVGSSADAHVRLQHSSVGGRHVRLYLKGDEWWAAAADPGARLAVDGQPLAPGVEDVRCWPGSMLEVGDFDLTLEMSATAPAESGAAESPPSVSRSGQSPSFTPTPEPPPPAPDLNDLEPEPTTVAPARTPAPARPPAQPSPATAARSPAPPPPPAAPVPLLSSSSESPQTVEVPLPIRTPSMTPPATTVSGGGPGGSAGVHRPSGVMAPPKPAEPEIREVRPEDSMAMPVQPPSGLRAPTPPRTTAVRPPPPPPASPPPLIGHRSTSMPPVSNRSDVTAAIPVGTRWDNLAPGRAGAGTASGSERPVLYYSGKDGERTLDFPADRPLTIGRGSACDLQIGIDGDKISRKHATFEWDGRRLWVTDSSANGTFVENVKSFGRTWVRPGAKVWLTRARAGDGWTSDHVLTFKFPPGAETSPPESSVPDHLATAAIPKPTEALPDLMAGGKPRPPTVAAPAAPAAGGPLERIGGVRVIGQVAQTPLGLVYTGEQDLAGGITRRVLVKLFNHMEGKSKEDARRKFLAETKVLLQLNHPGIVRVLDVGEHEGSPYLVMEHLTGTLRQRMADGPLPADQVRELLRQIGAALTALHEHPLRILHRDIKSDNIWLDEFGNFRLADFGLARFANHEPTIKPGTVRYSAPEIFNPTLGAVGPASDLYSLGYLAYESALGDERFRAEFPKVYKVRGQEESRWMEWHAIGKEYPRPLHEVSPDVPTDLSAVVARLMRRNQAERFADGRKLLASLSGAAVAFPAPEPAQAPAPADRPTASPREEQEAPARTMALSRSKWGKVAAEAAAAPPVFEPDDPPGASSAEAESRAPSVRQSSDSMRRPGGANSGIRRGSGLQRPAPAADAGIGSGLMVGVILGAGLLAVLLGAGVYLVYGTSLLSGGGDPAEKDGPSAKTDKTDKDDKGKTETPDVPPAAVELPASLENAFGMKFVRIPAGRIVPAHRAALGREEDVSAFLLGATEVTVRQFRAFRGGHQSGAREDLPATGISHAEAREFCRWLSEQVREKSAGRSYRLPTDLELEYAARGGGPVLSPGDMERLAADGDTPQPVMSKAASPWGVYDLYGNVWEWCSDAGAAPGKYVVRGGSFLDRRDRLAKGMRAEESETEGSRNDLGLRVVCVLRTGG